MAVLLNTSAGDIVIDLFVEDCPIASQNFLKLCKMKYYNGCLFFNVQSNYIIQCGDPTGTGKGGNSIFGLIDGQHASEFKDEINMPKHKMNKIGLVCMAHPVNKEDANKSQFFITLRNEELEHLEGRIDYNYILLYVGSLYLYFYIFIFIFPHYTIILF